MSNKLYKSFLSVSSISIFTRLVSFVFHIYISRLFGALNIGIFSIASSVFYMFSCFASSGFPVTLSRKIAHYDALKDYNHSDSMLSATLIITTAISSSICAFFYCFPSSLNLLFSNEKCHSVFKIMLPTLISTSIYATFRAWFWGKKKYCVYSLLEFADEIFLIFGIGIVFIFKIYQDIPYNALALANVIGDVFCMAIIGILFIIFGGKFKKPAYASEITTSSLPITSARIVGSLMSSLIALLLPSLLMHSGLTLDEATADYGRMSGMAIPIVLAPNTIIGSLIVVLIPEIASNVAKFGISSANKKIHYCIIFSGLISAYFMALFIALGSDIAILFYNDSKAGVMLATSALIIIPLVINQVTASMLNTLGKENSTFLTGIIASFGLILSLVIFAKYIGIYAYPLALLVYHIIGLTINTIKLKKTSKISIKYMLLLFIIFLIAVILGYTTKLIQMSYQNLHILARLVISGGIITILFAMITFPYYLKHKQTL